MASSLGKALDHYVDARKKKKFKLIEDKKGAAQIQKEMEKAKFFFKKINYELEKLIPVFKQSKKADLSYDPIHIKVKTHVPDSTGLIPE